MRSPWFEAAPCLAAAGFAAATPVTPQTVWSRFAMQPAPFALLPRLDAVTRPIVFQDLDTLAGHVERTRHGQGLDLVEVEDLHFQWRAAGGGKDIDPPARDRGVQIWTTDLGNNRDRCLGWAWLNGKGLEALMVALRRAGARAEHRKAEPPSHMDLQADSSPWRTRQARPSIVPEAARTACASDGLSPLETKW